MSEPSKRLLAETLSNWYADSGRHFPWRDSRDPYEVLIGEVLLQRTRGDLVAPIYEAFIEKWPTAERLGSAREDSIRKLIRPLGLAKRASNIKKLGGALRARGGSIPLDPDGLLELPGVGPYAAHAVPIFALGKNLPVVDWVIARVLKRYFGIQSNVRPNQDRDLWGLASGMLHYAKARPLWLGTLDFAAAVCRPKPRCSSCPLRASCVTGKALLQSEASSLKIPGFDLLRPKR